MGQKRCRVGAMSLATSCDITRHHAIGSGSGSGAGGIRCHSTEGVAEERRGGGSGRQAGVRSGSGRRAIVGSIRGSPYSDVAMVFTTIFEFYISYFECRDSAASQIPNVITLEHTRHQGCS